MLKFNRYVSSVFSVLALVGMSSNFALGESLVNTAMAPKALKRARHLNYPDLPKLIEAKILGKKSKAAQLKKDASLGKDWALASIGFFEVFSPLVTPLKKEVKACSDSVIVAVVDTGIDYTHPELQESIWVNKGETGAWTPPKHLASKTSCRDKSCNGIDDDQNGFVDDTVGWDFVHDVPLPFDTHGHGTHIAGIIASASANGMGTSGVCPRATIMPLKYYDNSGIGYNNLTNTIRAIQYAVQMGAHIINYSGGGSEPAPAERMAVLQAKKHGVLFVAAAGNEGRSNDRIPYYPASYGFDNIVGVASVNRANSLLTSSNYGKSVPLAAPGLMILSTLPSGRFGTMSGTSQATAFVTGAAALLASQLPGDPRKHTAQLRRWLVESAKPLANEKETALVSGGLLSVPAALAMQQREVAGPAAAVPAQVATAPKRSAKKVR